MYLFSVEKTYPLLRLQLLTQLGCKITQHFMGDSYKIFDESAWAIVAVHWISNEVHNAAFYLLYPFEFDNQPLHYYMYSFHDSTDIFCKSIIFAILYPKGTLN